LYFEKQAISETVAQGDLPVFAKGQNWRSRFREGQVT